MANFTYRAVLVRRTFLHVSMHICNHRLSIRHRHLGIRNHRLSIRNRRLSVRDPNVGIDDQFSLKWSC
jgi:hypothetical protein